MRHKWTLVTVTYNSVAALTRHWSNSRLPKDVEWIVVDNASGDESRDVAASLGARVIELDTNRGFGAANNVGFRASSGQYVAFINPDVTIDSDSLDGLDRLEAEITCAKGRLVAPQLVSPGGTPQPNGRGEPYLWWKIMHRLAPRSVRATYQRFADLGEVVPVAWLTGAVIAGSREHLAELGPWDEHFFVYYEDSDLGLRNARLGGESLLIGDVQWTHGWARETAGLSFSAWRREIPSMVKFYARYPHLLAPRTAAR